LPIRERIDSIENVRQWTGSIPLKYLYTAGVAGELFFEWLKKGKIEASRCDGCRISYLPPRMYCLECFSEVHSFIPIHDEGRVSAFTSLEDGGHRYVYVTYPKVKGGILHRVVSGKPRIGARASIVFKPERERTGSILDILGYKIL
jgi:uncharacterized OB-fold protein